MEPQFEDLSIILISARALRITLIEAKALLREVMGTLQLAGFVHLLELSVEL